LTICKPSLTMHLRRQAMIERHAWDLGKERAERLGREAALHHELRRVAGAAPRGSRVAVAARAMAAGLVRIADLIEGRRASLT
jgi:hypothetical protein